MASNIELALKNLDYMLDWIGRFDNKASIILGLNLGMLSLLVSFAPPFETWSRFVWISCILSLLSLGLSFICIYFSNFPRTSYPSESFFYFGSISKLKCLDFQQKFSLKTECEHIEDIISQVHRNAEILTIKFEYLKSAYLMLILGLIPWVITLFQFRTLSFLQGG